MQYAVIGRSAIVRHTKGLPRNPTVTPKKAHVIINGASVCGTERAYKHRPPKRFIANPEYSVICKLCRDEHRRAMHLIGVIDLFRATQYWSK